MNPLMYGVINAIFPGLSYLLLRKRQLFGMLLVMNGLSAIALMFVVPDMWDTALPTFDSNSIASLLSLTAFVTWVLAFGMDAYNLAKNGK